MFMKNNIVSRGLCNAQVMVMTFLENYVRSWYTTFYYSNMIYLTYSVSDLLVEEQLVFIAAHIVQVTSQFLKIQLVSSSVSWQKGQSPLIFNIDLWSLF